MFISKKLLVPPLGTCPSVRQIGDSTYLFSAGRKQYVVFSRRFSAAGVRADAQHPGGEVVEYALLRAQDLGGMITALNMSYASAKQVNRLKNGNVSLALSYLKI